MPSKETSLYEAEVFPASWDRVSALLFGGLRRPVVRAGKAVTMCPVLGLPPSTTLCYLPSALKSHSPGSLPSSRRMFKKVHLWLLVVPFSFLSWGL